MKLLLERRLFSPYSTVGVLSWPGGSCYTLEERIRAAGMKVEGLTAIPAGEYKLKVTHSPRLGVAMPLVCDVPGFADVRIQGSDVTRADGCILVVLDSRQAYAGLMAALDPAADHSITIVNVSPPSDLLTEG